MAPAAETSASARAAAAAEAALRFVRLTQCAVAERVTAVPVGSVLRSERLRGALQPNCAIVHAPGARPTADELLALAQDAHGDLRQQRVIVEDAALGAPLAERFAAAGWTVDRHLAMVLERDAAAVVAAPGEAGEIAPRAAREIEERIDREALVQLGLADQRLLERLLDDQLAFLDAMRAARRGRCFGVAGLSVCTLLSDGEVAQIEEVCTVPEARGRGLARAAVQAAADVALAEGHRLVFLLADADDWPKELYARLGFAGVGVRHVFSNYGADVGAGAAERPADGSGAR